MTGTDTAGGRPGPGAGPHPATGLDDTVHQRVRLGILAVLAEAQSADFTYLRDTLDLTDGNLARHLRVLGDAGYVTTRKATEAGRSRTWVSATRDGRAAFATEVAALRALLARAGGVDGDAASGARTTAVPDEGRVEGRRAMGAVGRDTMQAARGGR